MSGLQSCLVKSAVVCPPALPMPKPEKCEMNLNIGVFMDGTGNNYLLDKPRLKHSNVSRLFDAYREDRYEGYFRIYTAGVGTPFPEVGEYSASLPEQALGLKGDRRIVFALINVLDSIHRFLHNDLSLFTKEQILALCGDVKVNKREYPLSQEAGLLNQMGLTGSLCVDKSEREAFLQRHAADLRVQLFDPDTKPKVTAIYLDVFGFSRGSAQARVFCSWLHQSILQNGKLCGVPAYVRFLGIFDTVPSVLWSDGVFGTGHNGWASVEDLKIHPDVKNCVHYVALHELRTSFPLDSVLNPDGSRPSNCHEHFYPGVHSDLGGGYMPSTQGCGRTTTGGDSVIEMDQAKLSQMPLNDMYQAARRSTAAHPDQPWLDFDSIEGGNRELPEYFKESDKLRPAVQAYLANCGIPASLPLIEQIKQHNTLYLAWRYQLTIKNEFEAAMKIKTAGHEDEYKEAIAGQTDFKAQVAAHLARANPAPVGYLDFLTDVKVSHPKSEEILARLPNTVVHEQAAYFMHRYCHDSLAPFLGRASRNTIEREGYIRYRGLYMGSNEKLTIK